MDKVLINTCMEKVYKKWALKASFRPLFEFW